MSRDPRRSLVAGLATFSCCWLLGAGGAQAQIAAGDISPFPSEAWFDTGGHGDPGADGPDITAIHVEYKTLAGEEWAIFRFQTARNEDDRYPGGDPLEYLTNRTGVAGYLDVDLDTPGYEARFVVLRAENFVGTHQCPLQAPGQSTCPRADVILVLQRWESGGWQTVATHGWDPILPGRQQGARGRDDGGGSENGPWCTAGAACRGWVFDSAADLAPSHGAEIDGVAVVAVRLADLGIPTGTRPLLLAMPFVQRQAYYPDGGPAWDARNWLFQDGNPCHDPAAPLYKNGQCVPAGDYFAWADPVPEAAIATPASVDLVEAIPSGLRAEVVTVHGPTTLELWQHVPGGDVSFTGASVVATAPGVYTLSTGAPSSGAYLLVDRGPEGVFAVYDEDGRRVRGFSRHAALRGPPRSRPTARDGARDPVTSSSARGVGPVLPAKGRGSSSTSLRLVDVASTGGVVRLPARDGSDRVSALWIDGARHVAFPCAADLVCASLPPGDPSLPPPLHRVAVVEVSGAAPGGPPPQAAPQAGKKGPSGVGAGRGSSPADVRSALLVEHVRLPHPDLTQWWPAPLEEGRGIGWVWRSQIPEHSVVLDDAAGEVLAIELEALAWELGHAGHGFSVSLDGALLDEVVFEGPRAQVRVALEASLEAGTRTLTLATIDGVGAPDEALFFRGAFLERVRSTSLSDGPLYGVVREAGALRFDEDAFVIVRTPAGQERGVALAAGVSLDVSEGDEVAAVASAGLSAGHEVFRVPSLEEALAAETLVLVGTSAGSLAASEAAIAPFLTSLSASGEVVVLPAMGIGAALGGGSDVVERVVSWLSGRSAGPKSVVVIGSATERPEGELPSSDALHLPSPRRYAEGFNYASDAAPALDAYANGARLVSVTRVPVRSLTEAAAVSTRFAAAHAVGPSSKALVVADWSEDFTRSADRLYGALSSSGALSEASSPEVGYVNAYVTGRNAGITALHEAVHAGAGALWFVGHGSSKGLGGSLASPARFRALANEGARPLTLVGLSCLSGNVASDYGDRMPEELFRKATTVQGALLGSSQTLMQVHERVGDALAEARREGETTLAGAWRAAMKRLLDEGLPAHELSAYSLLGDPSAPL